MTIGVKYLDIHQQLQRILAFVGNHECERYGAELIIAQRHDRRACCEINHEPHTPGGFVGHKDADSMREQYAAEVVGVWDIHG